MQTNYDSTYTTTSSWVPYNDQPIVTMKPKTGLILNMEKHKFLVALIGTALVIIGLAVFFGVGSEQIIKHIFRKK